MPSITTTACVFMSGNSQAVRLPKAFQRKIGCFLRGAFASLAMSIISAGELRYGVSKITPFRRATELTRQLNLILTAISVAPLPTNAANHQGGARAQMDADGASMGHNDLWIAAHALARIMTLVTTSTRKFEQVAQAAAGKPGLTHPSC